MKKDKQFSIRIAAQDLETIRRKAAQAFARINTALRKLQEGGVAKSQSSIS